MDEGKTIFVSLSKGRLGEGDSALVGLVLVGSIPRETLHGRRCPESGESPFT